jgi:hypothetical protein
VSRAALEGGLIRALAGTSLKRSTLFPDLPTVAESALPGFDAVLSYGLVAPAGTPQPIIERLNKELRAALATDEVKRRLHQEGAEPTPTTRGARRRNRARGKQMVCSDQVDRPEAGMSAMRLSMKHDVPFRAARPAAVRRSPPSFRDAPKARARNP